jgi:hypothetical protein
MPEWLQVTLGILAGLAVLAAVFAVACFPRSRREKPSRLAPPSGRSDHDITTNYTNGITPDV